MGEIRERKSEKEESLENVNVQGQTEQKETGKEIEKIF